MNNTISCIILASLSALTLFISGGIEYAYVAIFYVGVGLICNSIEKGKK